MDRPEIALIILFAVWTVLGIAWVAWKRHQTIVEVASNPVPHEVREHSHQVKNEVTSVRAGLQRIAGADDPLDALVRTIRSRNHEGGP